MNRFTIPLLHFAALLLFIGLSAGTARAQTFYAAPNGTGVSPCTNPATPCVLADAVFDANGFGPGAEVLIRLSNVGGTTSFEEDLILAGFTVAVDMTFDTFVGPGPSATGVAGTVQLEGDVIIESLVTLTLPANVTLNLTGGVLEMRDQAAIDGDGTLGFTAAAGDHRIQLGNSTLPAPFTFKEAFLNNVRINKPLAEVEVTDQSNTDLEQSNLFIGNRLDVLNGLLNLNDNNLIIVSSNVAGAGMEIAANAGIDGEGDLFLSVEPAAIGGFPNAIPDGDADPLDDCFQITGEGFLNMNFDKDTDAGVCIMDLAEIGGGGTSHNRAGTLFVASAATHNGTFSNENAARTEFWALTSITTNLEVLGPGGEVDNTGTAFTNGTCETGNLFTGNESGVYFFSAVTVEEELIMTDTDDPVTAGCVEGVWFMGDANPDIQGVPPASAAKALTHQPFSTVKGLFTATFNTDESGIFLDSEDFVHNVAFQGSFAFGGGVSPVFELVDPADPGLTPVESADALELCDVYVNEADGNKVLFTGGVPQLLVYDALLDIQSVQINKDATGQSVTIDAGSDVFLVDTGLEVLTGNFITNGLLDLNSTMDPTAGGTVVISRDGTGDGVLATGTSPEAYVVATAGNPENLPRKVKYVGSTQHFTGAEIPGTASGSLGFNEVILQNFEIFLDSNTPIVTTSKNFTIADRLRLTQGSLQVGSADITLANKLQIAIGNGEILPPQTGGGTLIFPMVADNATNGNGIDLSYFGTSSPRVVSLEWPNSADNANVIRNVEINRECGTDDLVVQLRDGEDFQANPDDDDADTENDAAGFYIYDGGVLDINGNTLAINAANGIDNDLWVAEEADLTDSTDPFLNGANAKLAEASEALSAFRAAVLAADGGAQAKAAQALSASLSAFRAQASKTQTHAGLLKYIGGDDTDTFVETTVDRLEFRFPAIEVDKGNTGHATFDASGVLATTLPPIAPNRLDRLFTSHFELTDADLGDGDLVVGDEGGVLLDDGLDILEIGDWYHQHDGEFLMSGLSSLGPAPAQPVTQRVIVGGDFVEDNGEFFSAGGDVEVFGDFLVGAFLDGETIKDEPGPGDALFSLLADGELSVVGDFWVGPNTDPCTNENAAINNDECVGAATAEDDTKRNRFFLGDGSAFLFGDYTNAGTGDRFNDDAWLLQEQGLVGDVFFVGASQQDVWHRQDEDVFFNNVVMAGEGGIKLLNDGWQNDFGWLRLELGVIDTDEEQWDWIILNPGFESDLAGTNNSPACNDPDSPDFGTCASVVDLGSRDSYVNGEVTRVVEFGNSTGGVILGGYLFPVGSQGDPRDDGVGGDPRDVDFFRPLILQFPNDLGRSSVAQVDYRQDLTNANVEFPDDGLEVDDFGGENLVLEVVGNQFWQLEFDRIPSFDPNIRVEAASLPNVFDIKKLRLIQWDCDGTNPRLAGLYDVDRDPTDDVSAVLNDFIDGIPNLTQEGVNVESCQIIGIASSSINRIDIAPANGFARVQVIHNSPNAGPVDIYLNDVRVLDDFEFQTATPFVQIPIGDTKVDIVAGNDADNSSPVFSTDLTLRRNVAYVVAASGAVGTNFDVLVQDNVRLASSSGDVEFFTMHGAPDIGTVDLRTLDPVNNNAVSGLIANNIDFSQIEGYLSLAPAGYNIQVTNADNSVEYEVFRFDFNALGGETFTFLTSGSGSKAADGFTLIGFDIDGNPIRPQVVTDTEESAEVPGEFALDGNYPNPFNPSTTIQFDLPETAEVAIQVIDVLGRQVLTIPSQVVEAGTNRSLRVDAAALASGTYIYRVIARTATDTMVKTGRMTLVK